MMHLEIGGQRIPVPAGESVIGSAPGCTIVLEGEGVRPRHAVVNGSPQGGAAIRSAEPGAQLFINGVPLGHDPTPMLHGDKISIAGHELRAVDSRRTGHTQLFDSGAFTDLAPPAQTKKPPAGPTGGRLVCLTDGREYSIGEGVLVFGRDASADVVVGGNEVSRRHAEIRNTGEGYVLADLSVNGTYVNGQRIGKEHVLARADVIRIGTDEFRFYADSAPPPTPMPPRQTPPPEEGGVPLQPPTGAGARLSDTMHGMPLSELQPPPLPSGGEGPPLASLLVRSGPMRGNRLQVRVPVVNIGRADYNDVVIAEPSVSTTHAKLQCRDDVWVLTDLGSTNGTYVEGEAVTGETPLTPGTTLRFGEVAVLFEPLDVPVAARTPATEVMGRVDVSGPAAPPAAPPAPEEELRPIRPRRPIRAMAPKPSGPPAWLIALLTLGGAVAAYFFLTAS